MTPQTQPLDPARPIGGDGRSPRRRTLRAGAVVGLVVALGAPIVAHAAPGDGTGSSTDDTPTVSLMSRVVADLGEPTPPAAVTPIDPGFVVLIDAYEWDERSARVEDLQRLIGVDVDGWYAAVTRRAHLAALGALELPIVGVPEPELPPGPAPEKWAALRECESGGNYSITSASGKYRGAYQFDRSTWNSVASRFAPDLVNVDPAAATPADQDAMASALYSERGARPWPHCGRHLR